MAGRASMKNRDHRERDCTRRAPPAAYLLVLEWHEPLSKSNRLLAGSASRRKVSISATIRGETTLPTRSGGAAIILHPESQTHLWRKKLLANGQQFFSK